MNLLILSGHLENYILAVNIKLTLIVKTLLFNTYMHALLIAHTYMHACYLIQ